jgi:hypothetical protein
MRPEWGSGFARVGLTIALLPGWVKVTALTGQSLFLVDLFPEEVKRAVEDWIRKS